MFNFRRTKASRGAAADAHPCSESHQDMPQFSRMESFVSVGTAMSGTAMSGEGGLRFTKSDISEDQRCPNTAQSSGSVMSVVGSFGRRWKFQRASATTQRVFGHGICEMRRAQSMSCASVDLNSFLRERLVPVEGFACCRPADPKRTKTLKSMMSRLNESLRTQGIVDKKLRIPPEAFCRVFLHTVGEFDGNANLLADRAQLVRVQVKVHGNLLFPPNAPRRDRGHLQGTSSSAAAIEEAVQARSSPPRGRRRLKDGRWQLGFEARIALERSAEDAQAEDASVPALQVRVLAIDIENREDWDGDALIDSWLHTGDLLAEVEALIDDKLQDAVAETTGNPDDHAASRWL